MSKVSDVIEKGEAIPEPDEVVHYRIPGDASPLTLCGLDVWEDSTSITERAGSSNCTACRAAADEDKPEPGRCPSCDSPQPSMHPAVGGGGEVTGLCPDAFHGAAPSVLLDLVRQYGDDRAEAARRVATGGLALDVLSRAETLLDRITALVPQQPDPSVLSLPQVPRKNVVLVNAKGVRFVPVGAVSWCAEEGGGRCLGLGELIDLAGPVSVVMREPRTWPKLAGATEDLVRVRDSSGDVWRHLEDGWWAPASPTSPADARDLFRFSAIQETYGPLTEVFEDEPGGEPR